MYSNRYQQLIERHKSYKNLYLPNISTKKTNRGVINSELVQEGVLDHAEDVTISDVLPAASNETSDRSLWDIAGFFSKNYPEYDFRYQEQDVNYRLSTNKAIKGLRPNYDEDVRSIGTGVLLSPSTYAAIVLGTTIKDMRGRAQAVCDLLEYFDITVKDIEICQEGYLDNKEKFSWEKGKL